MYMFNPFELIEIDCNHNSFPSFYPHSVEKYQRTTTKQKRVVKNGEKGRQIIFVGYRFSFFLN